MAVRGVAGTPRTVLVSKASGELFRRSGNGRVHFRRCTVG